MQVISTDNSVALRAAQQAVRADILITEAAAPVNMLAAVRLFADTAGHRVILAEPFTADAASRAPGCAEDLTAFFTRRLFFGTVTAGRTKVLFEHEPGPGCAEFTVHLPAPAACKDVVGTDRSVAGWAVEKAVLADIVRAEAAAHLDMIIAEGLFADSAVDTMIIAEHSAADRTPYIQGSSAGFAGDDLTASVFGIVGGAGFPGLLPGVTILTCRDTP